MGVGPGGFTGLRAAIALAEGIALGAGRPLVGVTTGEALLAALPAECAGRARGLGRDRQPSRAGGAGDLRAGRGSAPAAAGRAAGRAAAAPTGAVVVLGDAARGRRRALRARGDAARARPGLPDAGGLARLAARRLAAGIAVARRCAALCRAAGGDRPGARGAGLSPPLIAAAGAEAAALLAALHAAAFAPADRWGAQAIGLMLALPGHFALLARSATSRSASCWAASRRGRRRS